MHKKYIAHAGIHLAATLAGKNSLRSIECAALAGFDYVELDVWITADGIPVALHNETLNATFRMRHTYEELPEEVYAARQTYGELREKYVLKADDPAHRTAIPTLEECVTLAKRLGITPMIHPKANDPASVQVMLDVCCAVLGAGNFVIVADNKACDYALSRDPQQPCMPVIRNIAGADKYTAYPNTIIAIRRAPDYDELVAYVHEKGHPVETTLNDDVRACLQADVINYDHLSPGRFERYRAAAEHTLDARTLAAGGSIRFTDVNAVSFGTVQASFTLCGRAVLRLGGGRFVREFTLCADVPTEYRAPVLLYNASAELELSAETDTEVSAICLHIAEHGNR